MITGTTPLDAALSYAARGWRVLPVHGVNADGSCRCGSDHAGSERSIGKHPLIRNGVHGATTDEAQIRAWWEVHRDASIAVATGAASDLLVLDVDGDEGQASLRMLEAEHGPLPETVAQVTGSGGEQYFFRHADGLRNAVKFLPGLDVRTEGGYVIVPPSLHRCGQRYEWDAGQHPDEVEVAIAPEWLVAVMASPVQDDDGPPVEIPTELQPEHVVNAARAYLAKVPGAVSGQGGHDATYRVACLIFQRFSLSLEQARELLDEWNERCVPPWSPDELDHKLADAARAPRRHECVAETLVDPASIKRLPPAPTANAPESKPALPPPREFTIAPVDSSLVFERGDDVELARDLQWRLASDRHDLVHDQGEVFRYVHGSGTWVPITRARLLDAVSDYAGTKVSGTKPLSLRHNAASGAISFVRAHLDSPGFFGDAPAAIGFVDGALFLHDDGTLELRPHHRDHRLRHTYDFAWESAGDCPQWLAALDRLLGSAWDGADRIRVIREHMGACLLGIAPRYQHVIALIGVGMNGKSFVLKVILGLAPPGTSCAIPPHTWNDEYRLAMLAGKLVNVVNELPRVDIAETEVFKAIVSGEPTTARHIREAPFTLHSRAGHVFAANAMPGSSDQSRGYWRRWIVVPFEADIPESEQIPNLHEVVLTGERAAIVRWCLEGVPDLVRRRGYAQPPSSMLALSTARDGSGSIDVFLGDLTTPARGGDIGTPSSVLYDAYCAWCRSRRATPVSATVFGLHLKKCGVREKRRSDALYYALRLGPHGGLPGSGRLSPSEAGGDHWTGPRS